MIRKQLGAMLLMVLWASEAGAEPQSAPDTSSATTTSTQSASAAASSTVGTNRGVFGAPTALPRELDARSDREPVVGADGAAALSYITPRGASTMVGVIAFTDNAGGLSSFVVDVTGAARGVYDVRLSGSLGCPPAPPPNEIATGEVDVDPVANRTPDMRSDLFAKSVIGSFSVTDDGRSRFETIIRANDLPDATRTGVLIYERPGVVNPSLADTIGLVGCSVITIPVQLRPAG